MKKGQTSLEFMLFTGIMLAMLAVASYAALQATADVKSENEVSDARRIASTVASEINLAAEIGDGYSHKFYMTAMIYNTNYSLSFYSGIVSVNWKNRSYVLPVVVGNITGNITQGQNTIRNTGGVIEFV